MAYDSVHIRACRHVGPFGLFLKKHINIISLMQFVVCIFFLLLMKLFEISLRDLLEENSMFLRLLGAKRWSFTNSTSRVTIYASDEETNSLLETRDMCGDVSGYDALVIVHTAVTHFQHRQRYRDTYGNFDFTRPYRLKIVFFLGLPSDPSLQSEILRENTQDGDTVQGNFTDTYRNLTYKAVMAYRWVSQNCRRVKVILKMDDDVILDVHRFFEEFVLPPIYQQELIFCHIWTLAEVERTGKWGISLQDYRGEYYPPYCSGFIVVVMPAIVEDLYETARDTPFLWLDDVFIYGVVRQEMRDVQLVNLDEVAFREEHYKACYKQYGYRCKYWATVLPEGQEFISMLLSLRAERLRVWGPEKPKTDNYTAML
ncbi:unnamed protein product [Candidula unifasciata]|uniref:Hexosyltransferase n=1 Tax=Candidula unifasciata TaxID=100452 RepID=A0A8S3ZTK1_9EUPU|nr:unnamed protein product [Candidula unifasciata]